MTLAELRHRDLGFVVGEIARFARPVDGDRRTTPSDRDLLAVLPRRGGGSVVIGEAAAHRLHALAERELAGYADLRNRIRVETLVAAIEQFFAEQVLDHGRPLDPRLSDKVVGRAVSHVRKHKLVDRRHFLPVRLGETAGLEAFSIGPVRFQRCDAFLRAYGDRLSGHLAIAADASGAASAAPGSDRTSDRVEATLRRRLADYGWIADTRVRGFDAGMSEQVARFSVETALNIVRVLLGTPHAEAMRSADGLRPESSTPALVELEDGRFQLRLRRPFAPSDAAAHDLRTALSGEAARGWIDAAAELIVTLQSGRGAPPLQRRLIDSLTWYGEAVADPLDHIKVIKFASAMEALLCTSEEHIVDQIVRRIAPLAPDGLVADAPSTAHAVRSFYDVRSGLVHGATSPFDPAILPEVRRGAVLARRAIVGGLWFSSWLARDDPGMSVAGIERRLDRDLAGFCAAHPVPEF